MEWLFMMLLLFLFKKASGLSFNANPDRVVVGDSGTITMACSLTESDVAKVYNMKIKRTVTPGSNTDELIASFVSGIPTIDERMINEKGFSVTGTFNGSSAQLDLSMDISKLTCSDARLYKCEIAYDSNTTGLIEIVESNITLQVFVLPKLVPPLQAKRNGNYIEVGASSDRVVFDVGDELELQCRANIGNKGSTKIEWRKSSDVYSGSFIEYQPTEGAFDESTPLGENQCGFIRKATIRYNVSAEDALFGLAFECFVSVSGYPSTELTPSGVYTTTNNLQYFVDVSRQTSQSTAALETKTSTPESKTAQSTEESKTAQSTEESKTAPSTEVAVTSCSSFTIVPVIVGVAIGSVPTLLTVFMFVVVKPFVRMRHGKKKCHEKGISMTHSTDDTSHVYINQVQHPATGFEFATPAEYDVLQESTRELSTYSDMNRELNLNKK